MAHPSFMRIRGFEQKKIKAAFKKTFFLPFEWSTKKASNLFFYFVLVRALRLNLTYLCFC